MSTLPISVLDTLVAAIAERVAAIVLEKLGSATTHYGTSKSAALPPGKTRAWAMRNLRAIPGAKKIGRDWTISVEDFDAWLSERDAARHVRKSLGEGHARPHASNDVDDDFAAMIEADVRAAGYRRTR